MRTKEVYELGFDIKEVTDKELKAIVGNKSAMILWCSIKSAHITPDGFNQLVLMIADRLGYFRGTWDEFLKIVRPLSKKYGTVSAGDTHFIIDNEFWADIYNAVRGRRLFKTVDKVSEPTTLHQHGEKTTPCRAQRNLIAHGMEQIKII